MSVINLNRRRFLATGAGAALNLQAQAPKKRVAAIICAYRKSYPRDRRPALNAANQTIDPRFARSNGRAPEIHDGIRIGRGLVRGGQ